MSLRRPFLVFTGLLVVALLLVPVISRAQNTEPDSLIDSILADLSQRLGHEFDRSNSNWNWAETKYSDSSLGCPKAGQTYTKGTFLGYQITVIYKGITYDYRAPEDNSNTFFLCKPSSLPSAPVVTFVPTVPPPTATLTPTMTVTPIPTTAATDLKLTVVSGTTAKPVSYTNPLAYVGKDGNIYITAPGSTSTTPLTTDGLGSHPVWSPDGTTIAFDDGPTIYVAQSGKTPQVVHLADHNPSSGPTIFWSGDGSAVITRQQTFYAPETPAPDQVYLTYTAFPLAGGAPKVIVPRLDGHGGQCTLESFGALDALYQAQFGPLGDGQLFQAVPGGFIYNAPNPGNCAGIGFISAGGQPGWHDDDLVRAQVAPDGHHLVALRKSMRGPVFGPGVSSDLVLVDTASGAETVISQIDQIEQVGWSSDGTFILVSTKTQGEVLSPPTNPVPDLVYLNVDMSSMGASDSGIDNDLQTYSVGFYKIPVGGGALQSLYQGTGTAIGGITASSDGDAVAFVEIPTTQALINAINANRPMDQLQAAAPQPELFLTSLTDGKVRHLGVGGWPTFGKGTFGVVSSTSVNITPTVAPSSTPTDVPSSTPVQCPGAPVSRLTAGGTGHVTPGSPNNLRSSPTGASIGKIPGGAQFQVLQGPTCLNNAAWWQVNYNGLIGWTAEGQGTTYYLVP